MTAAVQLDQKLREAFDAHKSGRIEEAENLYDDILKQRPRDAVALHYVGLLYYQRKEYAAAVESIGKAIAINKDYAEAYCNLGLALAGEGKRDEAMDAYRRSILLKPQNPEAYNNLGRSLLEQGKFDEAIEVFRKAIEYKPDFLLAQYNLGVSFQAQGKNEAAEAAFRRAIVMTPDFAKTYSNLGSVLLAQKKYDEAANAYRQAINLTPEDPESYCNLGCVLIESGDLDGAIELCHKALTLKPDLPLAHYNLGIAFRQKGDNENAVVAFQQATRLLPNFSGAFSNLGVTLMAQKKTDEALAAYREAIRLKPDNPDDYSNIGSALLAQGKFAEAIEACRKALELNPGFSLAHYNTGVALQRQGNDKDAVESFRQAIQRVPNFAEAWCNLGLALAAQGRKDEAIEAYRKAIECRPDFPEALNNLGLPLYEQGRLEEATEVFQRAATLNPKYADSYINLANAYRKREMMEEALDAFKRGLDVNPNNAKAWTELINLRRYACDWSNFDADEKKLMEFFEDVQPFILLNVQSTAEQQLACSRRWVSRFPRGVPFAHDRPRPEGRIRIGYLSADFRRHATAYLMAELFERHDRSRFETFAYSYGRDDESDVRQRLVNAFDHFVDLVATPHDESARRIYEDRIDILIDLKGYTGETRTPILVNRPAPVQVNYLGYPGTMGADFIDYIIADSFVAPMEHQPFYSEKIVHLPHCYQPNDTKREIYARKIAKHECDLPEQGLVFCSFNGVYKITPVFFDIWMRMLKAAPGSVLWLMAQQPMAQNNLRREAAARGVEPERLIFGQGLTLSQHLARHRLADLFLDTLPINAHTTASDTLWAGLPMLTCAGETFAGRVAGSLLRAVGLPELIAGSLADYEAKGLELATNPSKLAALKDKLARNLPAAPLFDINRYTRDLESAYIRMWNVWRAGESPQPIVVSAE